MSKRIAEIDYLKCVFILLMIAFHLVFFSDKYPWIKQWVYTFHMPAFLLLSGYLMRIEKHPGDFFRMMFWILIPYAIMETGYVIMSAVLPVREKVDALSAGLLIEKLFLHPMGPYWYLHTFMLCGLVYYGVFHPKGKINELSRLILTGVCYAILAECFQVVSLPNALYFLAGIAIRHGGLKFTSFFRPSFFAIIPLIWLSTYTTNLDRFTLGGAAIIYLIISLLLSIYPILPLHFKQFASYIGSHTLILLVFSPVFTMLSKILIPFLAFDNSGILFLIIAMVITVYGSFGIAWCMDRLHISPYFWGKEQILQPFRK